MIGTKKIISNFVLKFQNGKEYKEAIKVLSFEDFSILFSSLEISLKELDNIVLLVKAFRVLTRFSEFCEEVEEDTIKKLFLILNFENFQKSDMEIKFEKKSNLETIPNVIRRLDLISEICRVVINICSQSAFLPEYFSNFEFLKTFFFLFEKIEKESQNLSSKDEEKEKMEMKEMTGCAIQSIVFHEKGKSNLLKLCKSQNLNFHPIKMLCESLKNALKDSGIKNVKLISIILGIFNNLTSLFQFCLKLAKQDSLRLVVIALKTYPQVQDVISPAIGTLQNLSRDSNIALMMSNEETINTISSCLFLESSDFKRKASSTLLNIISPLNRNDENYLKNEKREILKKAIELSILVGEMLHVFPLTKSDSKDFDFVEKK